MVDFYLFQLINNLAFKWFWFDVCGKFFATDFGYILVFLLVLFLLLRFKKYWKIATKAVLAGVLSRMIIVNIIRAVFPRPRPFIENGVNLLMSYSNEPSFPSGHAAFYFAISTVVYFHNKKIGILLFLASALISISRVFVGIHWPSDILAGALVGIFSGWLVYKISQKIKSRG